MFLLRNRQLLNSMEKQGLSLTQSQTQKLSPLQIQTIKLIELSIQDLEQRVRQEIEENPVLDENTKNPDEDSKEISIDEMQQDDYIPDYRVHVNNWGKDPRPEYPTLSVKQSFIQNLSDQLNCISFPAGENDREVKRLKGIAEFIIGSLENDGYLRRPLSELADDIAFRANVDCDMEEMEKALKIVQSLDPAGVGARDLRECLLLQLRRMPKSRMVNLAINILENSFEELSNRHYGKIMSAYGLSEEEMKDVRNTIVHLTPNPGDGAGAGYKDVAEIITPDFVLQDDGTSISFTMPRYNIPSIKINRKYAEMLENAKGGSSREQKDAVTFVKDKMNSAKWFQEALQQRENTLRKTMQAILDFQEPFFRSGDEADLKPMILEDIANITGFDISTISRVVNSKYIETPYKIYPLKYFFSEGLVNKDGVEVSTREIKTKLQRLVDAEDKHKPLTDEQLVTELSKLGYNIARRTIAKYRDQLGIPLARLRKEL